jgi:hypothetical protein
MARPLSVPGRIRWYKLVRDAAIRYDPTPSGGLTNEVSSIGIETERFSEERAFAALCAVLDGGSGAGEGTAVVTGESLRKSVIAPPRHERRMFPGESGILTSASGSGARFAKTTAIRRRAGQANGAKT